MGSDNSKPLSGISSKTQESFDIDKFLGQWYRISYNKKVGDLQSGCDNSIVMILKSPKGNFALGTVCYKGGEPVGSAVAKLSYANPNDKSKMKLKFDATYLKFPVDYWVYETDYTKYAIVGNNSSGNFWILSRDAMSECFRKELVSKIAALGFDTKKIITDVGIIRPCSKEEAKLRYEKKIAEAGK